ncbi:MAG: spore germination protein [Clostridia bacterium]|nr:spore germination protein [Clostridia bacterium]
MKDIINNVFGYTPKNTYHFSLPDDSDNPESTTIQNSKDDQKNSPNIFENIDTNLDYIKTKYNLLINSDIVTRNFILNARGKQYKALLLYIDGMIDSQALNDFVLEPLMMRNKNNLFDSEQNRVISEAVTNNITVRKVKKFNLDEYIQNCLIPQNNVKKETSFKDIFSGVNSGNCALFVDTLPVCFNIDIKGFKQRSISQPENEVVIKGSHEAFVENIRTNTSLLRRLTNNENLIIENVKVGKITQTNCTVCYMQDITNSDLIAEVKYRLNNLEVDSLLSAGELEQLLTDNNILGVPKILVSERPDNAVKNLLQGRVIVLVNGSPYALIMPAVLIDFLSSPEDTNLKTIFANFLKRIRALAAFFTLLLPGLYVAITSFHREIIPTELLYTILGSRQSVPFPTIFEIIIMEISFEIIREAGLRVPSPIGPTLGIVGALVLGQAAVSAGIVSPILIIIVAITGISSFAIPDFTFSFHLRFFRFAFILSGFIAGFIGIGIGIFVYLSTLCDIESFGIPYTTPYAPAINSKNNGFLLPPIWRREYRANYLASKREKKQDKISMKWKF